MSTLKREMRLKAKSILAKYGVDDLALEMELVEVLYPYAERKPERKGSQVAMAEGMEEFKSITNDCIKYLNYSPNWQTHDNSKLMETLKLRTATGQTVKTFADWYWRNHWRGKQGQPPTSKDIQENWYAAFQSLETTPVTDDGSFYV